MVQGHRENGAEIMAEPVIITAIRRSGVENAYIGTIGDDGYVYFNDAMFYRFKPTGTWEQNVYVLNRVAVFSGLNARCSKRYQP